MPLLSPLPPPHTQPHTAVAHAGSQEMEHHINQLRHDGTRVVPVFVLALQNHPEDVVMANRWGVWGGWGGRIVCALKGGGGGGQSMLGL